MIKRKFIPGSEWLYLKIYTGIKTADIILEEIIDPIIKYFQEKKIISKWFFIRFHDPKPHVRLRFELKNQKNYNEILDHINHAFFDHIESGEISNIVADTYNREIERYGKKNIEDAETLFHLNSELTMQCLHYDDEEKIMVSLFIIDQILNKVNLSVQEKMVWIKNSNEAFKKEFNADKKLNSQLDKKYREFKPSFLDFIGSDEFRFERNSVISNIEQGNIALHNIIYHYQNQSFELSLLSFFQSIFHMNINRLFTSNQRFFEMIIYDYLLRYYKSLDYLKI